MDSGEFEHVHVVLVKSEQGENTASVTIDQPWQCDHASFTLKGVTKIEQTTTSGRPQVGVLCCVLGLAALAVSMSVLCCVLVVWF